MSARFSVVRAMPPSKLRGVSNAPSGFGSKHRLIRNGDEHWLNKGWEYLLPATNLPTRWSKCILGEVVWAICVEEINQEAGVYWFERRKDHWFTRQKLASHKKALHCRRMLKLVQDSTSQQPDAFSLYEAVMNYGWFNRGLELPEIEVGFSLDSFEANGDVFKGVVSQHTVCSESLEDFFDAETDWTPYFWSFSFEGQWRENKAGFEINSAAYVGNGSRRPLDLKTDEAKNTLREVFASHDLSSFLEDTEMAEEAFWALVNENFKFLRGERCLNNV